MPRMLYLDNADPLLHIWASRQLLCVFYLHHRICTVRKRRTCMQNFFNITSGANITGLDMPGTSCQAQLQSHLW